MVRDPSITLHYVTSPPHSAASRSTTTARSMSASSTSLQKDISQIREPYSRTVFTEDQLVSRTNPYLQFHAWFEEALKCTVIAEPNAMCLSTVDKEGRPSSRVVLMKKYSEEDGITFYTNLTSRKARDMTNNRHVCLLFYWPPLHRQVRIEGTVSLLSEEKAEEYFSSRPRASRISAMASPQSKPITSREQLDRMHAELCQEYSDESVPIPKPDFWGGYVVHPNMFEFWQGQSTRLHDRIVFQRDTEGWAIGRLAP